MSKIEIDLKLLEEHKLTPSEYVCLYVLFNDFKDKSKYLYNLNELELKEFIQKRPEGILFTKKSIDLFTKKIPKKELAKKEELYEFVEKYRAIFPDGIKSMDRIVKTDAYSCIKNFKKFKAKFKFTEEEILEATRQYINLKKKQNWHMITCADYFIEKNGSSMLASYCENLGKHVETKDKSLGNTQAI